MITPELLQYIRTQQDLGKTIAEISNALVTQSWSETDIAAAFSQISSLSPVQNSQSPSEQPKTIESWKSKDILDFKHMKWYEWLAFIPTLFMIVKGGAVGAGVGLLGWGVIFHIIRHTRHSKSIKTIFVVGVIIACFVIQTLLATIFLSLIDGLAS